MKKLWITLMTVVSVLGFMPAADAASGYVNMEVVLASTPAFVQAGKTLAAEQQKMQQQFEGDSFNPGEVEDVYIRRVFPRWDAQLQDEVSEWSERLLAPLYAHLEAES